MNPEAKPRGIHSNKINLIFLLFFVFTFGQQKITVEAIYAGEYQAKGMDELQSMKNTNQYTVLNFDRNSKTMQIDLFDYATLNKVATLIDTKDFAALTSIDSYTFDQAEKILEVFMTTEYEGGRHERRVAQLAESRSRVCACFLK